MGFFLGDIGGSKTRLIFLDSEKDLKKQNLKIFKTPQKYKEFLELLRNEYVVRINRNHNKLIQTDKNTNNNRDSIQKNKVRINLRESSQWFAAKKTRKTVFGFAGMLDEKREKLIYAPNLKDFENKNLKRDLEKILETEVILENDATLAGLGEGKYGVGKNFDVFGYITLSTGVGGAKIVKTRTNTNYSELMRIDTTTRTDTNNDNNHEPIRTNNSLYEFAPNDNVRNGSRLI